MRGKPVYETLNAMRGVAALGVVALHSHGPLIGFDIAPGGYLAVDLFFVLSGFVIAHAYDSRLATGMTAASFAQARIIRFWPLLVVAVLIGALRAGAGLAVGSETALTPGQLALATVSGLFLIPAPVTPAAHLFELNIPLWTLCFELLINFAYAICFRWLTSRVLAVVALVGGAAMIWMAIQHGSNDTGPIVATAVGGIGRAAFGFSIGVLLCRHPVRAPTLPTSLILIGLAALVCAPIPEPLRVTYDLVFAIGLAPVLVIVGAAATPQGLWLSVAKYLGAISFVIYAIHQPLIGMASTGAEMLDLPKLPIAVALVLGLLIVSPLIDRFYDEPVRAWLKSRLQKTAAPAEGAM